MADDVKRRPVPVRLWTTLSSGAVETLVVFDGSPSRALHEGVRTDTRQTALFASPPSGRSGFR